MVSHPIGGTKTVSGIELYGVKSNGKISERMTVSVSALTPQIMIWKFGVSSAPTVSGTAYFEMVKQLLQLLISDQFTTVPELNLAFLTSVSPQYVKAVISIEGKLRADSLPHKGVKYALIWMQSLPFKDESCIPIVSRAVAVILYI